MSPSCSARHFSYLASWYQIKALMERVNHLEARPSVEYLGVYEPGNTYTRGNMVTFKGSIWSCKVDTTKDAPTFNDVAIGPRPWQLACRAGRDGERRAEFEMSQMSRYANRTPSGTTPTRPLGAEPGRHYHVCALGPCG